MPRHIAIIIATFYQDIAKELVLGATTELEKTGQDTTYEIIEVPGAFEIPAAISMALASGRFEGFVALGCVIRGETSHYDYVCGESASGINRIAIEYQAAIGYGILTVENTEQAWVRAAVAQGNKGADAVKACLRMIEIQEMMAV